MNDVEYDRKICRSLLLSLVSKGDLCLSKVPDDVIQFIKGIDFFCSMHTVNFNLQLLYFLFKSACFIVRCGISGAEERIASIETYKTEFCTWMAENNNSNAE